MRTNSVVLEEVHSMVIMDIKVDNLFAFKNFHLNMSYPKKIVNSTIDSEYLSGRPNFRYKKLNIIMGGNATGKTTMGKVLMYFANYCIDGIYNRFIKAINDNTKTATLNIEFVTNDDSFYRFEMNINKNPSNDYKEQDFDIKIKKTKILKNDTYEKCKNKIDIGIFDEVKYDEIITEGWYFCYPKDGRKNYKAIENDNRYLKILERILKTLDPAIEGVKVVEEVENTYAIKLNNHSVIVKDGEINENDIEILSSGTKAGLDIAYFIASLVCNKHNLYYMDERFSYVNSDIEKTCLSIAIDKLTDRKQLFFTTHNTDILDMNLPKHSFTFLKKDLSDVDEPIKCIYASDYLKRNTDSIKNAVENDLFCISPELNELYSIDEL